MVKIQVALLFSFAFARTVVNSTDNITESSGKSQSNGLLLSIKESNETAQSFTFDSNIMSSDEILLRRGVKFAAASYCVDLGLKLWTCPHCLALGRNVQLIKIYNDLFTGAKAFLALDHSTRTIIVVFRGSSNISNWLSDMNYIMVEYEGVPGARVHQGFLQCLDSLKRKIAPELRDQIKRNPSYRVNFVGHSLGGAVAALATLEFRKYLNIPDSKIQLISYGEPRIGNSPFADYFTEQPFHMLRVVHNHDLVPHVPPTNFDFFHRKRMIFFSTAGLYDCQPNNWIDDTCTLAQKIGFSIVDHMNYFETFLGIGC